MYVRVVRFTDVLQSGSRSSSPPSTNPADRRQAPIAGLQLLFDEAQGTAVVLQLFDTTEDMRRGAVTFSAMDPSETPGTRVSVDMCNLKLERRMTG